MFYFVMTNQKFHVSTNFVHNFFCIFKILSPKKTFLLLMQNKNSTIELGSLWLLRFLIKFYIRLFSLKYIFSLYISPIFCIFSSCNSYSPSGTTKNLLRKPRRFVLVVHLDFYYHIFLLHIFIYYVQFFIFLDVFFLV